MNIYLCLIVTLLISFTSQAKTYRSFDAEIDARLVIIPTDNNNQFLISFDGFEHPFDSQAMLYTVRDINSDPRNGSVYQMEGTPFTNVRNNKRTTLLMGSAVPYIEVYLADRAPIKMIFTDHSDTAMIQRVKQRYEQSQGYTISKIAAKKQVKQAVSSFKNQCHPSIKVDIDWPAFSSEADKTTPAIAARYIQSLAKICLQDEDYKQAVLELNEVNFTLSEDKTTHIIKRDGAKINIGLAKDNPNNLETSYIELMKLF
ncbi:hypothetical protein [Rheinheimera sp. WS51]|uniref:hypothetical protein n=1 Tax=Rheinheimera sp. WS51 TaxID=3425886 RepID=UPI003D941AC3